MKRLAAGLLAVGLTCFFAARVPHDAPKRECAVTLRVDGTWAPAEPSDLDALHFEC